MPLPLLAKRHERWSWKGKVDGTLRPSTAGFAFKSVVHSPESFFDMNPIGMPLLTDGITCLKPSKDGYCRVYQRSKGSGRS
jgi:hypothetical protein